MPKISRVKLLKQVKIDGAWYFAERQLILKWSETRALGTEAT